MTGLFYGTVERKPDQHKKNRTVTSGWAESKPSEATAGSNTSGTILSPAVSAGRKCHHGNVNALHAVVVGQAILVSCHSAAADTALRFAQELARTLVVQDFAPHRRFQFSLVHIYISCIKTLHHFDTAYWGPFLSS